MIIANAYVTQARYKELSMPVVIIAGDQDRLVDIETQSSRLHRELPQSLMHRVPGAGHMVHQTATEQVVDAIGEAAKAADGVSIKGVDDPFASSAAVQPHEAIAD